MTDLSTIKAALAAATEGPWTAEESEQFSDSYNQQYTLLTVEPDVADCNSREDMHLIVLLRNSAPDLIAEVERLREEHDLARRDLVTIRGIRLEVEGLTRQLIGQRDEAEAGLAREKERADSLAAHIEEIRSDHGWKRDGRELRELVTEIVESNRVLSAQLTEAMSNYRKVEERADSLERQLAECRAGQPVHRGGYIEFDGEKWWAAHLLHQAEQTIRDLLAAYQCAGRLTPDADTDATGHPLDPRYVTARNAYQSPEKNESQRDYDTSLLVEPGGASVEESEVPSMGGA